MNGPAFLARRRGFTLVELLAVLAITMSLAAVSLPVLGVMVRDTRLAAAVSRLKVGMQQMRAILSDYAFADQSSTSPPIAGAVYTGTALVVRWDDVRQDYEMFYAISAQNALGGGGAADFLASRSPALRGYSVFANLEPMTLGPGIRLAGLRRNATNGLELVPSPSNSFAICMDATGVGIPPAPAIYVNLQQAPAQGGAGPWNTWDTAMYDDAGADTGAYAGTYGINGGTGEGFLTSLPMVVVYRDDDLPLSGNAPSGAAWRVDNPANPGSLMVNPALPVNDLLAQTRGRVVMLTMQGGSPAEY